MSPRSAVLGLTVAALLLFAGCGGGGSEETSAPATAGAGTTSPSAEAPAPSGADQGKTSKKQSSAAADGKEKTKPKGSKVPLPEGEREPGITPQQRKKATTANIRLESSAFKGGMPLPTKFTCEGKSTSPPLRWSDVPSDAEELVVLALNMLPVEGALFFDWAVAGLDPSLSGLEEGKLPAGAVLGTNSFGKRGYGLCPPSKGKEERYLFMVYAIPEALDPKAGFDPLQMREAVLAQAGNVGLLATSYTRR